MHKSRIILVTFSALFFGYCGDGQKPLLVLTPPQEETVKLDMYPKSAFIGYKLLIFDHDSTHFEDPTIFFPSRLGTYADSIINDTIYVTVPFCTTGGPLSIESSKIKATTDIFTPIKSCRNEICISDWDLNYDISEKDAHDQISGTPWSYQISADTIHIYIHARGPNYDKDINLFFRSDTTMDLPIFIDGDFHIFGQGSFTMELEQVQFKIFRWELDGILAGRFFFIAKNIWPINETFWVDLSK